MHLTSNYKLIDEKLEDSKEVTRSRRRTDDNPMVKRKRQTLLCKANVELREP